MAAEGEGGGLKGEVLLSASMEPRPDGRGGQYDMLWERARHASFNGAAA